jgi:hypothetical protein
MVFFKGKRAKQKTVLCVCVCVCMCVCVCVCVCVCMFLKKIAQDAKGTCFNVRGNTC